MTKKELRRIENALDWYEGTDGSEKMQAASEMYEILVDIYNKNVK